MRTLLHVLRRHWALLALVIALAASLYWRVHPWYDEEADASMYILATRSLLAGEGYRCVGIPFIVRPPGYSLLLTPVLAASDTGFLALNLYSSLIAVAALILFFVFFKELLGPLLALALCLLVWFSPPFERLSSKPLSDIPGVLLLFGCLLLERRLRGRSSLAGDALLGLTIGLAAYMRTILVFAAPAIVLSRWLQRDGERPDRRSRLAGASLVIAIPLVLLAPWQAYVRAAHPEPPVDQTSLYSYATAMWHVDRGDPSSPFVGWEAIARRVPTRARQVVLGLGNRLGSTEAGASAWMIGGLLLAALAVQLLRRRRPAELFAAANMTLLLVYFDFAPRLLLPAFLISLAAAAALAREVIARHASRRAAEWIAAGLVLALAALDFRPRAAWDAVQARHAAMAESCSALASRASPGETLGAGLGWQLAVFLDRPVYSLCWAVRRHGMADGVASVIERYGLDLVLLSDELESDRELLHYFRGRYPAVAEAGSATLFRVGTLDAEDRSRSSGSAMLGR